MWDVQDEVLVIDNTRTLHARAAADAEPDREVQRWSLVAQKEESR